MFQIYFNWSILFKYSYGEHSFRRTGIKFRLEMNYQNRDQILVQILVIARQRLPIRQISYGLQFRLTFDRVYRTDCRWKPFGYCCWGECSESSGVRKSVCERDRIFPKEPPRSTKGKQSSMKGSQRDGTSFDRRFILDMFCTGWVVPFNSSWYILFV